MCEPWTVHQFNGHSSSRPRCQPDGSFSPKQCSDDGSCWCVDSAGDMIEGSMIPNGAILQCQIGEYYEILQLEGARLWTARISSVSG